MSKLWDLIRFEYKKIFKSKAVVVFLAVSFCMPIIISLLNVSGGGYYSKREEISNFEALALDREIIQQNKGPAEEELFKEAVLTAQRILKDENSYFIANDGVKRLKDDAWHEYVLPYRNIYFFINALYDDGSGTAVVETIEASRLDDVYKDYKIALNENILNNGKLSQAEKEKQLEMAEKIQTPFYNDYLDGWNSIKSLFPFVGMLILLVLAVVCSNLFSKEYSNRTDALILSSKLGKNKLIAAKFITGMSFGGIFCLVLSSFFILCFLIWHGFTGGNVPIQLLSGYHFSPYPVTIFGAVATCVLVFTVICMLFCCFALMLSAVCKNSLTTLSVLSVLIVGSVMLPRISNRLIEQVIRLMPARAFDFSSVFSEYFYTFGSISFTPAVFYVIFSIIGCAVLLPIGCRSFKNHQVG